MDLKILSEDKEKLSFLIKGVNFAYINALRRLIIDEVPTLAIDEIEFKANDSALFNEVLAHRIGLVPLTTDLKSYSLKEKCKCKDKGCNHCQSILTLKVKGPANVYAEDLRSKDPKVKAAQPKLLIAKLFKDQNLDFSAIAVLGKGNQHTRFSPGLAYYRSYPILKFDSCKNANEVVQSCPKKILEVSNQKLKCKEILKCDLCMACVDACNGNGVSAEPSKTDFLFFVESWGQLEPREIITEAINILGEKLESFEEELKKIK